MNVDLTKDLPKQLNFNIQGEDVMVEYSYAWLPKKCLKCEKWGHSVKICPLEKENQREEQEDFEEGEIRDQMRRIRRKFRLKKRRYRSEKNMEIQEVRTLGDAVELKWLIIREKKKSIKIVLT